MFGSKKKTPEEKKASEQTGGGSPSLIALGSTVMGDVNSEGEIRVDGRIQGKLVCRNRLVVGQKGRIDGNIDANNATIAGEIHGTLTVRDVLQLLESARIYGDIITERIVIQQGAIFTGNSKMGAEAKEILKNTPVPDLLKGLINSSSQSKHEHHDDNPKNTKKN